MLPPLHDKQRAVVFRWGVLAVFAACALAPLSGSPSNSGIHAAGTGEGANLNPLPRFTIPTIRIAADPFVSKVAVIPADTQARAVVLGRTAHALVEIGTKEVLIGVGDAIGGVRVVGIDDRGVHLSDGSLIPLRGARP